MDSISILRKVAIKSVVTDELKKSLQSEVNRALAEIDKALKDIKTEHQKQQLSPSRNENLLSALIAEANRMLSAKAEYDERKKEIDALSIGGEYMQGVMEGPVTIKLGDKIFEKINGAEIVVKDGEVIEIRGKGQ